MYAFPLSRNKARISALITLGTVLGILATAIRENKEIKGKRLEKMKENCLCFQTTQLSIWKSQGIYKNNS